jgi:hypothetical protein
MLHRNVQLCVICIAVKVINIMYSTVSDRLPTGRAVSLTREGVLFRSLSEVGHGCWAFMRGSQSAFQFIPQEQHLELTGATVSAALAGQKFDKLTCWKGGIPWWCRVESHCALQYSSSTANVSLWILHGCVLNFIHLSAMGVDEITKSTHFQGGPHTFWHVVYFLIAFLESESTASANVPLPHLRWKPKNY